MKKFNKPFEVRALRDAHGCPPWFSTRWELEWEPAFENKTGARR